MNAGDTFAHYEIIGPIGRGAMGEVFSARSVRVVVNWFTELRQN